MPNLTVPYQRGNLGLQTLVAERIQKWGKPARYSEYVTGYKSAANFSGHNPDSNGIVHAVDIFVGPGNLTPAQGVELYDAVRREGVRGNTDGHPKRTTYVIHNRLISGDFNGWTNEAYTGPDPHTDHVHVSSHDGYWGDPLPTSYGPADYDSTLTWNLNTTTGQGSNITPITEGFLMALTDKQQEDIYHELCMPNGRAARAKRVADELFGRSFDSAGAMKGRKTSLGLMVQWNDDHIVQILSAVAAAAASDGGTVAEIQEAVVQALKDNVVKVDVTVAGGQ